MPDEIVSSGTVNAHTEGLSHEWGVEGEASAPFGVGSVKARGALKHSGSESTTESETTARTKVHAGSEGYKRECRRMEDAWLNERIKLAEPYGQ